MNGWRQADPSSSTMAIKSPSMLTHNSDSFAPPSYPYPPPPSYPYPPPVPSYTETSQSVTTPPPPPPPPPPIADGSSPAYTSQPLSMSYPSFVDLNHVQYPLARSPLPSVYPYTHTSWAPDGMEERKPQTTHVPGTEAYAHSYAPPTTASASSSSSYAQAHSYRHQQDNGYGNDTAAAGQPLKVKKNVAFHSNTNAGSPPPTNPNATRIPPPPAFLPDAAPLPPQKDSFFREIFSNIPNVLKYALMGAGGGALYGCFQNLTSKRMIHYQLSPNPKFFHIDPMMSKYFHRMADYRHYHEDAYCEALKTTDALFKHESTIRRCGARHGDKSLAKMWVKGVILALTHMERWINDPKHLVKFRKLKQATWNRLLTHFRNIIRRVNAKIYPRTGFVKFKEKRNPMHYVCRQFTPDANDPSAMTCRRCGQYKNYHRPEEKASASATDSAAAPASASHAAAPPSAREDEERQTADMAHHMQRMSRTRHSQSQSQSQFRSRSTQEDEGQNPPD